MELTKSKDSFKYLKESELPTILASPSVYHDRSTQDFSMHLNASTSLQISPDPKLRSTGESSFSPFLSSFGSPYKEKRLRTPKSHVALEEKLMKIEQDYHKTARSGELEERNTFVMPRESSYINEYDVDFSRGNLEIPTLMWCAYCKGEMATEVVYVNGTKTFLSSVGIFLSGGFLGCFLLPYVTNSCKSMQILCKKCHRVLG